jgi:alanine-synthesizing transaminase
MFSSRLQWSLEPNPITRLLREKRDAGSAILDLTESNPTRAGIEYPSGEILAALADERSLRYDPDPAGIAEARAAVAEYYGGSVDPGRILLTASTSEAYSYLFKLLADAGDEILVPRPSYPLFEFLAALESVRVAQYPLAYHEGWGIDFEELRARIGYRTRAIVVVNPNNPTGSFLKTHEIDQLVELAARHDLALISDEVFADYAFGEDSSCVPSLTGVTGALTFSLSGLSKVAALPQMKLGWIVTSGPAELRASAFERLELIADTFLSVNTPVQHAAARLLALRGEIQRRILDRVSRNLDFLRERLRANPAWRMLDLEGGWYATLQAPRVRTEEEWVLDLLRDDDVLTQPGFFFDFASEAFLVVGLLTAPPVFEEGIRRMLSDARR